MRQAVLEAAFLRFAGRIVQHRPSSPDPTFAGPRTLGAHQTACKHGAALVGSAAGAAGVRGQLLGLLLAGRGAARFQEGESPLVFPQRQEQRPQQRRAVVVPDLVGSSLRERGGSSLGGGWVPSGRHVR